MLPGERRGNPGLSCISWLWSKALHRKKKKREGGGGTPASYIISPGCPGLEMKITTDLGRDMGASGEQALNSLGTVCDVF